MLRKWLPISVAVLGVVGCGGSDSGGGGSTPPEDTIQIVADVNRDGEILVDDIDLPGDQWDATVGASFIANLDDDDMDGVRDCDDEIINGESDFWDLAPFSVAPWPTIPSDAVGVVAIDQESAESIRIFKRNLDGSNSLVLGSIGACTSPTDCSYTTEIQLTAEEIKVGVLFYIEARRFKGMPLASLATDDQAKKMAWNGYVDLTFKVQKPDSTLLTAPKTPDGIDKLKMRVAPWVLLGSMGPHDTLYSSDASSPLVSGNTIFTEDAGAGYVKIADSYSKPGGWGDWWTEDIFQTGWTGFPGKDGAVRGMRIANARPWGRPPFNNPTKEQYLQYAPIRWILGDPAHSRAPAILGPDFGGAAFYDQKHEGSGNTQDSHGNHDLVPPFDGYPMGRIIHGDKCLAETTAFYDAQEVQGPAIKIDTTWLAVQHVDEFFHWVPANTARGWKLLVASPGLMTKMLQDMKAAGNGSAILHQGKGQYQESVDECLADTQLMGWSQTADVKIQGHIDTMKQETGLTDDDIIEIPTWFEDIGGKVAWNPGMVNMRMLGDNANIAKPFGPLINGSDPFEEYVKDVLGTPKNQLGADGQGLKVHFTDDWAYHVAEGEVHCATNESAPAPFADSFWWESGK